MTSSDNNKNSRHPDLLIVGGDADPNIIRMVVRCNELGVHFKTVLMGKSGTPPVTVDVRRNELIVNGEPLQPKSVFVRPNVFEYLETKNPDAQARAANWFGMTIGWMLGNPGVRFFNRRYYHRNSVNKLETLLVASSLGFFVPETYFTNDIHVINSKASEDSWIEKPVDGGAYTKLLQARDPGAYATEILGAPITIQQKLVFPEVRIFRIGSELFAFRLTSDKLDYRDSTNTTMVACDVPTVFREPFFKLTEYLGLEYAAADFKTDETSGQLALLEVNSGPMYGGFDQVCRGALSKAMIEYLTDKKIPA